MANRDFELLFASTAVSRVGSEISYIAFPLAAIVALQAGPEQVGLLNAATTAAFLLIGLPAGVWVDRMRRRPVLLAADLVRFLLLAWVPLAWWWGILTMTQLFVVAFLVGAGRVFSDVAAQSYLPAVVGREHLVAGNARLAGTEAVSRIVGRGAGGALVQALTAPVAIAVDAVTYLWSFLCLCLIRRPEPAPAVPDGPRHLWREIGEGLRYVAGQPALRAVAASGALVNLASTVIVVIVPLLIVRELRLQEGLVGVFFAVGGVGAVLGTMAARRLALRFGYGRTLIVAATTVAPIYLLLPFADRGVWLWAAAVAYLLMMAKASIDNVLLVSFRQTITPDRMLGRMNATMRFVLSGALPIGSVLAGFVGEYVSLRAALWCGTVGMAVAWVPIFLSPLRTMVVLPTGPAEPAPVAATPR
ncbi:MFS transporter [Micromonospora sp. NPDC005171]|uniref:MFS transporter n=1 Tax=Micromonospora sp. NPDC005171 TaxID=3156866 RepID=UPI0033AA35AB